MPKHSKAILATFATTASIAVIALLSWAFLTFVYTPTQLVHVENDLTVPVLISGDNCSSRDVALDVGETGDVEPLLSRPHAACIVTNTTNSHYLGCLTVGTEKYAEDDTALVSTLVTSTSRNKCGD